MLCGKLWFTWLSYCRSDIGLKLKMPFLCTWELYYVPLRFLLIFSTFLGPNGTFYARCHFRAQKVSIFRAPPPEMALVMDMPPQNHYFPHHINNRCINSYQTSWKRKMSLRKHIRTASNEQFLSSLFVLRPLSGPRGWPVLSLSSAQTPGERWGHSSDLGLSPRKQDDVSALNFTFLNCKQSPNAVL